MPLSSRGVWLSVLMLALTVAAYAGSIFGQFLNWDDTVYVWQNPVVPKGITWAGIKYAFTTFDSSNYIPLTWLSYELDASLCRWLQSPPATLSQSGLQLDPSVFHLTNLILHVVNVQLVFRLLRELSGREGRSAVAALLFAVHPLHVESVAWISARKDVLSTLFLLLTVLAYLKYVRRPHWWRYALVCLFFVLGLSAKSILVTVPILLLAADLTVLHRLRSTSETPTDEPNPSASAERIDVRSPRRTLHFLIWEKVPLSIISLCFGLVTIAAQISGKAMTTTDPMPLPARLGHALSSYGWYLATTLMPYNLSPLYLHPSYDRAHWNPFGAETLGAAVVLIIVTIGVTWTSRKRPLSCFCWWWFVITLLPVVGLIQVGAQAYADRYSYVPHIGLIAFLVWEVDERLQSWSGSRAWQMGLAAALILGSTWLTVQQVAVWRDSATLWQHAIRLNPANFIAHANLAAWYGFLNRPEDSIREYQEVLKLRPDDAESHFDLALFQHRLGQLAEAEERYRDVLKLAPGHDRAAISLAALLWSRNRMDDAIQSLEKFAQGNPQSSAVWLRLGLMQKSRGRFDQASESLAQAVLLAPNDVDMRLNLGLVLSQLGKLPEAKLELETAVQLAPLRADCRFHLDHLLEQMGQRAEATRE